MPLYRLGLGFKKVLMVSSGIFSTIGIIYYLFTPLSTGGYLELGRFSIAIALSLILPAYSLYSIYKGRFSRTILCVTVAFSYYTMFGELSSYETLTYVMLLVYLLVSQPIAGILGNSSNARVESSKLGLALTVMEHLTIIGIFIVLVLAISMVVGGVVKVLSMDIPKPYYYITRYLASSRLGILGIIGVVAFAISWIVKGATSLAVLYLDIDSGEAISIVKTEAFREYMRMKEPLPLPLNYIIHLSYVLFLSAILWNFTYTLARIFTPNIINNYPGLLYLGFIVVSYVSYRIVVVMLRQLPTINIRGDYVIYGLIGILVVLLTSVILGGRSGLILYSSLTGASYGYDPLKSFVLYFEQNILQAQESFKDLEEALEVLLKMLWG